jgi:hypothetical protein
VVFDADTVSGALGPVGTRLALWKERRERTLSGEQSCSITDFHQRRRITELLSRAGKEQAVASLDARALPPA